MVPRAVSLPLSLILENMSREAFWEKIKRSIQKKSVVLGGEGGCITWTGALDRHGYGRKAVVWPDGKKSEVGVHRLVYMAKQDLMWDEIPTNDGGGHPLDVSHLCHNKVCVNTEHLTLERREVNNDRVHCFHQHRCSRWHDPHCLFFS